MTDVKLLNILLYDTEIGTITNLPGDRNLFSFNQDYIENINRPTLSLSFKNIYNELITSTKATQTRLPPFFSNLLPEGILREYLAKQAGIKSQREFYMLWLLGRDLPGALKAIPEPGQTLPVELSETLHKKSDNHEGDNLFRFSLARVQMKFSAIQKNQDKLTIPANGVGGSWIIKLPDARYAHVPENEYAMMQLARTIGIEVPDNKLLPIEQVAGLPEELYQQHAKVFAIKRFDRSKKIELVHIEDFAQVFNVYADKKYGHASYRNIAEIIWKEIGDQGIIEFIRRLVFNILIGNGDMHLKNWSLIYPDKKTPALAPAYDLVSTIPYIKNDTLALNVVGEKKFSALNKGKFMKLANKAEVPEQLIISTLDETVDRFAESWETMSKDHLSSTLKQAIDHHLATLPLWNNR